jgi:undecaprenyl-diphosphatase
LPILHAIVLGIVQGLTEFFPISSSGHLLLVPWIFGWNDFTAADGLQKTFDVALHIGTLAGAIAYFRADIARYLKAGVLVALFRSRYQGTRVSHDGRIAWLLAMASIPAALTGALFSGVIERHLDDKIWLIAAMLILFGFVLHFADRRPGRREIDSFGVRDALAMGAGQALALQPGVSRSGVTISVGRFLGLDRAAAARTSFLMSVIITAGAVAFKLKDLGSIPSSFYMPFFWGVVTSAITGWLAVWATLRLVTTKTFTAFVVYRVVAGLAVLALLSTPWR